MNPLRLAAVGASGRMGRTVVRLAAASDDFEVVCAVAQHEIGAEVGALAGIGSLGVRVVSNVDAISSCRADVIIDFSTPSITRTLVEAAARANIPLVSGTTGLGQDTFHALDAASKHIPLLWEANMSIGIYVLGELLKQAVFLLGSQFDIEIVETHHRQKVDAPSGTAFKLAEIAQQAQSEPSHLVHGRQGHTGLRSDQEIGVHAVRGGGVFGEHDVHFLGLHESVQLTHRATSRDIWAQGALTAARWIVGQPPGRYPLSEVIQNKGDKRAHLHKTGGLPN